MGYHQREFTDADHPAKVSRRHSLTSCSVEPMESMYMIIPKAMKIPHRAGFAVGDIQAPDNYQRGWWNLGLKNPQDMNLTSVPPEKLKAMLRAQDEACLLFDLP